MINKKKKKALATTEKKKSFSTKAMNRRLKGKMYNVTKIPLWINFNISQAKLFVISAPIDSHSWGGQIATCLP